MVEALVEQRALNFRRLYGPRSTTEYLRKLTLIKKQVTKIITPYRTEDRLPEAFPPELSAVQLLGFREHTLGLLSVSGLMQSMGEGRTRPNLLTPVATAVRKGNGIAA